MDTPDKNIQPSPSSLFSKFEDSPVFNYLSTLSPIRTFNSSNSGPSFHLFNFASPPSARISPLTNLSKESKISRAILLPDEPKNNNSSQSDIEVRVANSIGAAHHEEVGNFGSSLEATVSTSDGSSKPGIELPNSLKYDLGSPQNNASVPSDHISTPTKEKQYQVSDEKCVDSGALSFASIALQKLPNDFNDSEKLNSVFPRDYSESRDMDSTPMTKSGTVETNGSNLIQAVKSCAVLQEEVVHYSGTELDDKDCPPQQRMTRRRCLVYEMSGTHYRKMLDSSPISNSSASPNTSKEKCPVAHKPGGNKSSTHHLPGIGLHLNALTAATKDKRIVVNRQTLTCRRQLISSSSTISSIDLSCSDKKPLNTSIATSLAGSDGNEQEKEVVATENACQNSVFGEGVEFPQNSPKKKRRKPDNVGEGESCKNCNCKRSKCLKLYCECFAAGLYCVGSCNCQDCFNTPLHEETVLETRRQIESRNPLAFAPKVIRCSTTPNNAVELKKTPASARHKRGCNCKKSGCLKKYCECFQGGVGCSLSCRCEGCKNTFGHKEGPEVIAIWRGAQMPKPDVEDHDEGPPEPSKQQDEANAKMLKQEMQPLKQPCLFSDMTPQSVPLMIAAALQSCETRKTECPEEPGFTENDVKRVSEDETQEVLTGDYLLPTCVKSASPNCKRVSSPHCHDFETSPGWRSCRKLILRSIPSFPTLTPEQKSKEPQRNVP